MQVANVFRGWRVDVNNKGKRGPRIGRTGKEKETSTNASLWKLMQRGAEEELEEEGGRRRGEVPERPSMCHLHFQIE